MTGIDAGLAERFARAEATIAWRPAAGARAAAERIAHLNDEEARVRRKARSTGLCLTTDPGPVGALVIVAEVGRRGAPEFLEALDSTDGPFGGGALRATWGGKPPKPAGRPIPLSDVVGVARYALA